MHKKKLFVNEKKPKRKIRGLFLDDITSAVNSLQTGILSPHAIIQHISSLTADAVENLNSYDSSFLLEQLQLIRQKVGSEYDYELSDIIDSLTPTLDRPNRVLPINIVSQLESLMQLGYVGKVWDKLEEITFAEPYSLGQNFIPYELARLAKIYTVRGVNDSHAQQAYNFLTRTVLDENYDKKKNFSLIDMAAILYFGKNVLRKDSNELLPLVEYFEKYIDDDLLFERHELEFSSSAYLAYTFAKTNRIVPRLLQEKFEKAHFDLKKLKNQSGDYYSRASAIDQIYKAYKKIGKPVPANINEAHQIVKVNENLQWPETCIRSSSTQGLD